MNRSPILFRCDGTPDLGWESLYMSLVLAAAMQRRRRGTHFLAQLEPFGLATTVTRGNNDWRPALYPVGSQDDLVETVREIRRLNAAAVVLAGANIPADYVEELQRQTGVMVTLFDSQAQGEFTNRLVVNPLLAPAMPSYTRSRRTQLLIGARYPMVRSIFRRQRPLRSTEPPQPFRAMVAMGDDDFQSQAVERTQQLLGTSRVESVSVVVRSHHPQMEELETLVKQHGARVEIVTELPDLAKRLGRVHFAVTAGDSMSLELACIGIPQLIMAQNGIHARNGQKLAEEGGATYLGDATQVTNATLRQAVQSLLSDPLERISMSRCARQLVDGRGPDRMVNAMEILLHADQRAATQSRTMVG